MRLAIASGKGGTGKTTVAVNLAAQLLKNGRSMVLADCDVEEPNVHLFYPGISFQEREVHMPIPEVDQTKCQGESCQSCVYLCRFKALIWMVDEVMVFPELCHGCGLCHEACPADAIKEGTRLVGMLRYGSVYNGPPVVDGRLRVGEAMAPPLIREVKSKAGNSGKDIALFDCPPGTSCPMITSVQGADAAILVTEPTPFGLHDLILAVETLRQLGIPFGVVINRHGIGDSGVEKYLGRENIPLLAKIPHSEEAARAYSKGKLLVNELPELATTFDKLWLEIENLLPATTEGPHA